ncbi:MAG: methyltransferase domain-containing protein [Actinomycetota bacterium]
MTSPGGIRGDDGFYHRAYDITDDETKQFYADWAETYDEELVDGRAYAMPMRCAEALTRHLDPGDNPVIDLGCGTGLLGRQLAARGHRTLDGVDYSPEMLGRAEATGVYRRLWSADLNERQEPDDGAYAAVAAMGVFSFGHVYAGALDEMTRILAPGGPLVIGVNEVFVEEGSLTAKIETLEGAGAVEVVEAEYGDHMPESGVRGWVYVLRRLSSR